MIKATMVIAGLLATPMTSEMPSMKECMEQRDILLKQNEALEVTCVPKQSEISKHQEMFDMFLDVVDYIQERQIEQCMIIAEETGRASCDMGEHYE